MKNEKLLSERISRTDQIYRRNPYLEISFPGDEIRGGEMVRAKNIRSTT